MHNQGQDHHEINNTAIKLYPTCRWVNQQFVAFLDSKVL